MRDSRSSSRVWIAIAATLLLSSPPDSGAQGQARPANPGALRGAVLWRDPGRVEALDFTGGPGGMASRPLGPFRFLEVLSSGTRPKVKVRDRRGRVWVVKWGHEAKPENFVTRLVWAAGYYVIPSYYVRTGQLVNASALGRAGGYVDERGRFQEARFQAWEEKLLGKNDWTWDYNPFLGTRELDGLKIMMMLTSNWDGKDARDVDIGSNTAIVDRSRPGHPEYRYLISDWGASMGDWGVPAIQRDKWNCHGYTEQTKSFVKGVKDGIVQWGYAGARSLGGEIPVTHVAWLLRTVGRITDRQLREGLIASGATPEEVGCYLPAVRARIRMLQDAVGSDRRGIMRSAAPAARPGSQPASR
jgi:hypothetical protein